MKLPRNNNESATAQQLQDLSDRKPYRNVPICVMQALQGDDRLTLLEQAIWFNYNSKRNLDTWVVSNNPHRLARELDRKLRTIYLCLNNLENFGYLKPVSYNKDANSTVAAYQVTMPPEAYEKCLEAPDRAEADPTIKNPTRDELIDVSGKVTGSLYKNEPGPLVLVWDESVDAETVKRVVKENNFHAPAGDAQCVERAGDKDTLYIEAPEQAILPAENENEVQEVSVEPAPLTPEQEVQKSKIETEIEVLSEKIKLGKTPILTGMHLRAERRDKERKLEALIEPLEKTTQAINKLVIFKKQENTTEVKPVNPSTQKNNNYISENTQAGMREPICYRNNPMIEVPKKCVRAVEQAVEDNRSRISDPSGVIKELLWSIAKQFVGKPTSNPNASLGEILIFNTRAAIKIIRENRWTKPAGFTPQEEIAAERKAERDKENKLRRRTNPNGYVPTPMAMVDLKAILGI